MRTRHALRHSEPEAGVAGFLESIAASPKLGPCVVHRDTIPAEPAQLKPIPSWIDPRLRAALKRQGIEKLYSHQAQALRLAHGGRDVLAVTPTASGKSLIYLLPILQGCLEDPARRAILIYPFKALEQDQRDAIRELTGDLGPGAPSLAIYDGDTPVQERKRIRANPPNLLITNPDMLHLGLLAYHAEWSSLLSNLAYLVVDELHVYRGIFGCHMAHVLRRLQRVCAGHGSRPQLFASSATVANPQELGQLLTGRDFALIDSCGAPRQIRHLMFFNPALRMSPYTAAAHLFSEAVLAGHRTIAFTKARRITELIHSWVLQGHPELSGRISSYRAGYLPEERRAIEQRLFRGEITGVISTSALELGVDIGGLDLCLLIGYPGSIVSTWQRMGRTGRGSRESAAILVALPDALDQYFMSHPDQFRARGYEPVVLDPANPEVARAHLICAGAEQPITPDDRELYGDEIYGMLPELERTHALVRDATEERWYALRRRPQRLLSLRSTGQAFRIQTPPGRLVGTVDPVRAYFECHPGAIYLHQGQAYKVRTMDHDARKVTVERADVDYYTEALADKQTEILEEFESRSIETMTLHVGRIRVTEQVTGYARRRLFSQERLGEETLDLPPVQFETVGLWMALPQALTTLATSRGHHFMGSIHAVEHCAISLAPLYAACDRGDLGGISYPLNPQVGSAAIFIYDGHPGGIGLSRRTYAALEDLLRQTLETLRGCPCEEGCPSCIHSPKCGNGNKPLDKAGAVFVLEALTGEIDLGIEPHPLTTPLKAKPTPAKNLIITGEQPMPSNESSQRLHTAGGRGTHPGMLSASDSQGDLFGPGGSGGGSDRGTGPGAEGGGSSSGTGGTGSLPEGKILIFDLETQKSADEVGGWSHIDKMGLGLAVTFDLHREKFLVFFEQNVEKLLIELLSADLVVGFNVKRFDYTVLRPYTDVDLAKRLSTLDMLEHIKEKLGFRLKLNSLAAATLNETKTADGLQSLKWWKEGRYDLIEMYCKKDVEVTSRLYRFGRKNGYLLYHDLEQRKVRLPVEF
ncbi:MAG: DEAD/DEAH box helicase [Acidobacteria bacterium]|nr:DEAD/DEAH box helicase [Acidobacteriota bacterium]